MPHLKAEPTESLAQRQRQVLVELERENTVETVEQWLGQRAAAGPDLQHPRRNVIEEGDDFLGNITIHEEVLTESVPFGPPHVKPCEF